MSEHERTRTRDLTYSRWHRTDSLTQYIGRRAAFSCAAIDIDFCEYCRWCRHPLALIETQMGDRPPKEAPVMARLAQLAQLPAFTVSLTYDLTRFQIRQLIPERGPIVEMTPAEYAEHLHALRLMHDCDR